MLCHTSRYRNLCVRYENEKLAILGQPELGVRIYDYGIELTRVLRRCRQELSHLLLLPSPGIMGINYALPSLLASYWKHMLVIFYQSIQLQLTAYTEV